MGVITLTEVSMAHVTEQLLSLSVVLVWLSPAIVAAAGALLRFGAAPTPAPA